MLCTPTESRVTPASRNPRMAPGLFRDSGLPSSVTSALPVTRKSLDMVSRMDPTSSGESRLGVPPPKKTVETVFPVEPSLYAHQRISLRRAGR